VRRFFFHARTLSFAGGRVAPGQGQVIGIGNQNRGKPSDGRSGTLSGRSRQKGLVVQDPAELHCFPRRLPTLHWRGFDFSRSIIFHSATEQLVFQQGTKLLLFVGYGYR